MYCAFHNGNLTFDNGMFFLRLELDEEPEDAALATLLGRHKKDEEPDLESGVPLNFVSAHPSDVSIEIPPHVGEILFRKISTGTHYKLYGGARDVHEKLRAVHPHGIIQQAF